MITYKNKPKLVYEGEGRSIGLKTVIFKYNSILNTSNAIDEAYSFIKKWSKKANNFFIDTDYIDIFLYVLIYRLSELGKKVIIETENINIMGQLSTLESAKGLNFFYIVDKFYDNFARLNKEDYIKIRVLKKEDFKNKLKLANKYAKKYDCEVLLMPEFTFSAKKIGQLLMDNIDKLNPSVRFMPPVQDILRIP